MIQLLELQPGDEPNTILRVYGGLRDWNIAEILAAFPYSDNPLIDALLFHMNTPAIKRFVFRDDEPIALAGCIPLDNGDGRLYFIGTPEVEEHGVRIAALIRRFLPEAMDFYKIHRLTCRAMQGNPKTPRWFKALGGVFTRSEQDQFGTYFDIYEWSLDDVLRRRGSGRSGSGGSATAEGRTGSSEPDSGRNGNDQSDILTVQ